MKKLIKFSALLLVSGLISTAVFAGAKTGKTEGPNEKDAVTFSSLSQDRGVQIAVKKVEAGKSFVTIYDSENNLLIKDFLPKKASNVEKGYVLTDLEEGNYTIEVTSNNEVVKQVVHVYYDENYNKSFFFMQ